MKSVCPIHPRHSIPDPILCSLDEYEFVTWISMSISSLAEVTTLGLHFLCTKCWLWIISGLLNGTSRGGGFVYDEPTPKPPPIIRWANLTKRIKISTQSTHERYKSSELLLSTMRSLDVSFRHRLSLHSSDGSPVTSLECLQRWKSFVRAMSITARQLPRPQSAVTAVKAQE